MARRPRGSSQQPRSRDYAAEYQARQSRARALGWESDRERAAARREAAAELGLTGRRDQTSSRLIDTYAEFQRDFASQDWTGRVDELKGAFTDFFGYYDDDDFYDWLDELYGE